MAETETETNVYPGHHLDLRFMPDRWDDEQYPIGAHQACPGALSEVLPVREVFMMLLMDRLTDKPGWEKKIFNDEITSKWRKEAEEMDQGPWYRDITEGKSKSKLHEPRVRLINSEVFDQCLAELKGKAKHFEQTGLIPTLDSACNTVIKSDTLLSEDLKTELRAAFDKLRADQASNVDWHPRSNEQVQDLVHPSMYPFVFGRSQFIEEEVVGVSDAVQKWSGKSGIVLAKLEQEPQNYHRRSIDDIPNDYWSVNYQWLPANVAFQDDGSVKFTSYINNLHPDKYPEIYKTIEKLVEVALPAWDHCTGPYSKGNKLVGGIQNSRFEKPGYCDDENDDLWEHLNEETFAELSKLEKYQLSEREEWRLTMDIQDILDEEEEEEDGNTEEEEDLESPALKAKEEAARAKAIKNRMWDKIRDPIFPMPKETPEEINYAPKARLRELFKDDGLQIIVKMATIELTPEKPEFPVGGWHIEGQMNERICATALYYLDSENVTPSHLSFRMSTSAYTNEDFQAGQDSYNYLEQVYGTDFGYNGACLQNYGSVETREGRLLAFPNVFQHRVSPFKLQDPTKPGHRRFIALWLVDPHTRIISTANVPPQQLSWWVEATFGAGDKPERGTVPPEVFQVLQEGGVAELYPGDRTTNENRLPAEVMEMVRREGVVPPGLMTAEEAREHRLALMKERSSFHQDSERGFQEANYSFCEH